MKKIFVYFFAIFLCSCAFQTGRFDENGERIGNPREKYVIIGFNNEDVEPYILTMWQKNTPFERVWIIRQEIIIPGSVAVYCVRGGEYGISLRRGSGYFLEGDIILWDEGDFVIKKRSVDKKIDLADLYKRLRG